MANFVILCVAIVLVQAVGSLAGSCSSSVPRVDGAMACSKSTRTSTSNGRTTETMTVKYCCSDSGDDAGTVTCTNGKWGSVPSASNCGGGGDDDGDDDDGNNGGYWPPAPVSAPAPAPAPAPRPAPAPSSGGSSGGSSSDCGINSVSYGAPYSQPVTNPRCDPGYSLAMCLRSSNQLKQLVPVPIDAVVQLHNCWRRKVNNPAPARPLPALKWDDKLAQMAERAAAQCQFAHTAQNQLYMPAHNGLPAWSWVGQNLYASTANTKDIWGQALDNPQAGWVGSEIGKYCYGCSNSGAGHYTQVIAERSEYIGCGHGNCGDWQYLFCNYGPGGNFNDGQSKPYTAARSRRRLFNDLENEE